MSIFVKANEATAAKRYVYFHLVDATDGMTAETGEAGGQPQISSNGAAWTNTGISVLAAIGNGRYYAELTQTAVLTAGTIIETRYKSANTAECPGDKVQVVGFDPSTAYSTHDDPDPNGYVDVAVSTRAVDSTVAKDATVAKEATLADIKGSGWSNSSDTLEKIREAIQNVPAQRQTQEI